MLTIHMGGILHSVNEKKYILNDYLILAVLLYVNRLIERTNRNDMFYLIIYSRLPYAYFNL